MLFDLLILVFFEYPSGNAVFFFQAKSLSARNYAREMIRTLHMVDSNAATKTLQEAILANSIVSFQGIRGKAMATDLALELHNNDLKRERKNRSSSTQEQDAVLAQCALNGPYLGILRRAVLLWLRVPSKGYHPPNFNA